MGRVSSSGRVTSAADGRGGTHISGSSGRKTSQRSVISIAVDASSLCHATSGYFQHEELTSLFYGWETQDDAVWLALTTGNPFFTTKATERFLTVTTPGC